MRSVHSKSPARLPWVTSGVLALALTLPAAAHAEITSEALTPLMGLNPAAGIGILDPGRDGGLPLNIWDGTDADLAKNLIDGIPANNQIPVLRDLSRRVLTSTVRAPENSADDFALHRLYALLRLGYAAEARQLALAIRTLNSDVAQRTMATADLLAGNTDQACATLRDADRENTAGDGYWERLDLLCQTLDNNRGAVSFLSNLLRETGYGSETLLLAAQAVVLGQQDTVADTLDPDATDLRVIDPVDEPVLFALLSRAGMVAADDAPLLHQQAWLNQQTAPLKEAIPALSHARRLARAGWLSGDAYRDILARAGFATDDLRDPIGTAADDLVGGDRFSLLVEAANSEAIDAAKAELIAAAWSENLPIAGGTLTLMADLVATVTPGPGTESIAPLAFLLFSALDRPDQAAPWVRQLGQHPAAPVGQFIREMDRRTGTAATLPNTAVFAELLPTARAAQQALQQGQPTGIARSASMIGIGEDQANIGALTTLLTAPADSRGQAQVVLAAMVLAGQQDMTSLSPVLVNLLTGSLYRVGLEAEARQFAKQAVLAKAVELGLDGISGNRRGNDE